MNRDRTSPSNQHYIQHDQFDPVFSQAQQTRRVTGGFINYLQRAQ